MSIPVQSTFFLHSNIIICLIVSFEEVQKRPDNNLMKNNLEKYHFLIFEKKHSNQYK